MDERDELLLQLAEDAKGAHNSRRHLLQYSSEYDAPRGSGTSDEDAGESDAPGHSAGSRLFPRKRPARRSNALHPDGPVMRALRTLSVHRSPRDLTLIKAWLLKLPARVRKFFSCLDRLNAEDTETLLRAVSITKVRHGTLLYKQGDAGNSFYVLLTGRVAVYHSPQGSTDPATSANNGSVTFGTTGSAGIRLLDHREEVVGGLVGYASKSAVGLLSSTGIVPRLHSVVAVHDNAGGSGVTGSPGAAGDAIMEVELGEDGESKAAAPSAAPGEATLLQIDGRTFDRFSPLLRRVIASAKQRAAVLQSNFTLRLLPHNELLFLASVANVRKHAPGTIVHAEGDDVRSVSVVLDGVLDVACVHVPCSVEDMAVKTPKAKPKPKKRKNTAAELGFGSKSGGKLTLELVRGPAVFGEVEAVRRHMLPQGDVPLDDSDDEERDGRLRYQASTTVGGETTATIASWNWRVFLNVVCHQGNEDTKNRVVALSKGRLQWYDLRRDYQFSGDSQNLSPVFLEGVQCRLIGCHLCGEKSHGVNECEDEEGNSPRGSPTPTAVAQGGASAAAGNADAQPATAKSKGGGLRVDTNTAGSERPNPLASPGSRQGAGSPLGSPARSGDLARFAVHNASPLGQLTRKGSGVMSPPGSPTSVGRKEEDWNNSPRRLSRQQSTIRRTQLQSSVKSSLAAVLRAVIQFKKLLLRRQQRKAREEEAAAAAAASQGKKSRRGRRARRSDDKAGLTFSTSDGLIREVSYSSSGASSDDDDLLGLSGSLEPRRAPRRSLRLSTSRDFSSSNTLHSLLGTHSSNRMSFGHSAVSTASTSDDDGTPVARRSKRLSHSRSMVSPTKRGLLPMKHTKSRHALGSRTPGARRSRRAARLSTGSHATRPSTSGGLGSRVSFHVPADAGGRKQFVDRADRTVGERRSRRHTVGQSKPDGDARPHTAATSTGADGTAAASRARVGRSATREPTRRKRPSQLTVTSDSTASWDDDTPAKSGSMSAHARLSRGRSPVTPGSRGVGAGFSFSNRGKVRHSSTARSPTSNKATKSPRTPRSFARSPVRLAPIQSLGEAAMTFEIASADAVSAGNAVTTPQTPESKDDATPTTTGAATPASTTSVPVVRGAVAGSDRTIDVLSSDRTMDTEDGGAASSPATTERLPTTYEINGEEAQDRGAGDAAATAEPATPPAGDDTGVGQAPTQAQKRVSNTFSYASPSDQLGGPRSSLQPLGSGSSTALVLSSSGRRNPRPLASAGGTRRASASSGVSLGSDDDVSPLQVDTAACDSPSPSRPLAGDASDVVAGHDTSAASSSSRPLFLQEAGFGSRSSLASRGSVRDSGAGSSQRGGSRRSLNQLLAVEGVGSSVRSLSPRRVHGQSQGKSADDAAQPSTLPPLHTSPQASTATEPFSSASSFGRRPRRSGIAVSTSLSPKAASAGLNTPLSGSFGAATSPRHANGSPPSPSTLRPARSSPDVLEASPKAMQHSRSVGAFGSDSGPLLGAFSHSHVLLASGGSKDGGAQASTAGVLRPMITRPRTSAARRYFRADTEGLAGSLTSPISVDTGFAPTDGLTKTHRQKRRSRADVGASTLGSVASLADAPPQSPGATIPWSSLSPKVGRMSAAAPIGYAKVIVGGGALAVRRRRHHSSASTNRVSMSRGASRQPDLSAMLTSSTMPLRRTASGGDTTTASPVARPRTSATPGRSTGKATAPAMSPFQATPGAPESPAQSWGFGT